MEDRDKTRSCGNCKFLSEPVVVKFDGGAEETRAVCLCGNWRSSALLYSIFKKHADRYRKSH